MLSWLPENVSTYGGQIDRLFYLIYYITTAHLLRRADRAARLPVHVSRPAGPARHLHARQHHARDRLDGRPGRPAGVLALLSRSDVGGHQGAPAPVGLQSSRSPPSSSTGRSPTRGSTASSAPRTTSRMDNELHVPVDKTVRIAAQVAATSSTASSSRASASSRTWCRGTRSRRGSRRRRPGSTRSRAPSCAASATPA